MMQMSPNDARSLAHAGITALGKGDASSARTAFDRIVLAGHADASIFLGVAYACSALRDHTAALVAVNAVLDLEPGNLRALIFKADYFVSLGDARAASSFYLAVVQSSPPPDQLPSDIRAEVVRAQAMCDRYAHTFEASLRTQLSAMVATTGKASKRFTHSLDILCGKKKVFFQDPKYYYFPELPQIQFYERADFPWLDRVEAATAAIREELLEILKDGATFQPYVQGNANRPKSAQNGMLNNPDWSAFYLWKNGKIVAENAARCPRTIKALADAPIPQVAGRSPSILFSLLRPGARIPPHNGFVNTRLIVHLPLIVPPGCGFRVGNETRDWVEGKAWLFDDTVEHEAWNLSDQARVILLFEIWRPELTQDERVLVGAMFEAIDGQSGAPSEWSS